MTLIQFKHREDCGDEYYVQILNFGSHFPKPLKNRSILQCSFSWNEYSSSPYIQLSSGNNTLFSIMFWVYKIGFDLDVFASTWNWEYLDDVDSASYVA